MRPRCWSRSTCRAAPSLTTILQRSGPLPAKFAEGHIYIAPLDRDLHRELALLDRGMGEPQQRHRLARARCKKVLATMGYAGRAVGIA